MRRLACAVICTAVGLSGLSLRAADPPVVGIVAKEMARRDARVREAKVLITEGAILHAKGEFDQAASAYRQAWDVLPDSPMTAALRIEARDGYSRAAVAQAEKLASTGRYTESRALLSSVLAEDFDPANQDARTLQKRLDDPERYEPALTPQHVANVAEVERTLRLASGFITLGDYTSAIARFEDVLRIDPHNSAARRGMERAEQLKSEYFDSARDHSRARMLSEVDRQWEDAIPVSDLAALFGAGSAGMGIIGGTKESILLKVRTQIIPVVEMQGASLEEVVEFLRIRSRELDPLGRGVSFVLKVSPETAAKPVSLSMVGVPVEEVLRYATEMTGTVYRADEYAITITSRAEKTSQLITRSYRVPPGFLTSTPAPSPDAVPVDPFAPPTGAAASGFGSLQIQRLGAREFLQGRGVPFPEGATASYSPGANLLVVTNTVENLVLVDSLVEDASNASPKQIEIQVRIVEVNETRLQELGFDWLMSPFNVPGSERVFATAGTVGNGVDFAGEVPSAVGTNPITSGLRSSGAILGAPSIDQLLVGARTPPIDSRSPANFAAMGAFTDPQFQGVIRTLSQSKGVDLMAAPTIVTKAGQRSTINIVREFIYPTEYDPPQIPQDTDPGTTATLQGIPPVVTSVTTNAYTLPTTPSTPTAFEKRDVGISMEVEAIVSDDGRTVDLNIVPSSTEFEGFIDYGQDFSSYTVGQVLNNLGGNFFAFNTVNYFPVDNPVLQPVFRSSKVTTSVTVWDSNTVVLGAVMYERSQKIKDKVPFIGNIPIVGRAFQSQVTQRERKNVIFFVTVNVIDPGGNRVNQPVLNPTAAAR